MRLPLMHVAGVDKIVVLFDGAVAEQGNSDMLLKKNGIYAAW